MSAPGRALARKLAALIVADAERAALFKIDHPRTRAIAAYVSGILSQPIIITTDRDLTPVGKRVARIVKLRGAMGTVERIRWYVARRIYNQLPVTAENVALTREWVG